MRVTEKWEGRMPGVGAGGADWKPRARRAEAESEAGRAAAVSKQLQMDARVLELQRGFDETTNSISWRLTGAAAPPQRLAAPSSPGATSRPSRARRISSFETTACPLAMPSRWRRRDRRSATKKALESSMRLSTVSSRASLSLHLGALDEVEVRDRQVQHSVRLQALEQRVAVPGLQECRQPVRPRRVAAPDHAQSEEHRHDREAQIVASLDEVLHCGEHAVLWATFPRGRTAVGKAAGADSLDAREQAAALRDRLAPVLGDQLGRVVVVAPPVRPGDVVEQEQRQRRSRPLVDEPQLLAHGVVVVIAVDHDGIGHLDVLSASRLVSRTSSSSVVRLCQLHQPVLRRRVDGGHPCARLRSPVHEHGGSGRRHTRRSPRRTVRSAVSRDRQEQLGVVDERVGPAAWIVCEGVGLHTNRPAGGAV